MDLIHGDGFAQYCAAGASQSTHELDILYESVASGLEVGTDYGIDGRYGVNFSTAVGSLGLTLAKLVPGTASYTELWFGARIYLPAGTLNTNEFIQPFACYGPAAGLGSLGTGIRIYRDGSVHFFRNNTTEVGTPSAAGWFPTNVKVWCESHMRLHDTLGIMELKVNGQTHTFSGDTAHVAGETLISQVHQRTSLADMQFSDYVIDKTGYTGDQEVSMGFTTGDGFDVTALTQVGGAASKWQSVNERAHDGDTTAVDLTATGRGLFTFPAAGSVAPAAIVVHQVARKVGTGAATLALTVRSGGSEASVGSHALADTFAAYEDVMMLNPVTAAAWAASAAIELGPERV